MRIVADQFLLNRLHAIEAVERQVVEKAEARNQLEGYLYRLQNLLGPDAGSKALQDFSTESEKKQLEAALAAGFEWMSENADKANAADLRDQRDDIECVQVYNGSACIEAETILSTGLWRNRSSSDSRSTKADRKRSTIIKSR